MIQLSKQKVVSIKKNYKPQKVIKTSASNFNNEVVVKQIYPDDFVLIPDWVVPNIRPIYYANPKSGLIYNSYTKSFLPSYIFYNKDKYITIHILTDYGSICVQPHRIILTMFNYIPGCENLDVNHKDGVKYHNNLSNLEWVDRSQNIQHALKTGLFNVGETRQNSILTNVEVEQICQYISEGKKNAEIIELMPETAQKCVIRNTLQNIRNRHCWTHISDKYDFPKK